jgi:hypothetical protein
MGLRNRAITRTAISFKEETPTDNPVNSVECNPVNKEVLTVIGSDATWDCGFGSTGWLQKVGINLNVQDHVRWQHSASVMICIAVPGGVKRVAKTTRRSQFRPGKHEVV